MENSTVSFHESEMANATTDYKPLSIQTAVGAILCAMVLISLFLKLLGPEPFITDWNSYIKYQFYCETLWPSVSYLIKAVCFGVLIKYANNKATRIALIIGTVLWTTYIVGGYYRGLFLLHDNDIIPKIFTDELRAPLHAICDSIPFGILNYIGAGFAWIYLYSLIIKNNVLSAKNKMWINTLAVLALASVFLVFSRFVTPINEIEKVMGREWLYTERNHLSFTLTYNFMIVPIWNIMNAAAYWHFARCEAFSGKYDTSAKCNYSPLNKWMAMAVIAPTIMFLCIFLLYKNYELFI